MAMKTIALEFRKKVATGLKDSLNNPTFTIGAFIINDCLIAPVIEPVDRIETAALDRNQAIVRIHLPKNDTADVSDSEVEYGGQTWRVIGKPVQFMNENTPTQWNRYVRAESING
jgi:hypothetical protein